MKRQKGLPPKALERGIALAKELVEPHKDPTVPAGDRLRDIGKKLNVTRIEAGAVRVSGFLKRLEDGSYAIYFANDCGIARRRFTVAHELAHLVLEKIYKHLGRLQPEVAWDGHHPELESAVDRIASELLMPEALVVGLMKKECEFQRHESMSERLEKRAILQAVGTCLGVSERALVSRLLDLPDFLAVLLRAQWNKKEESAPVTYCPIRQSRQCYMRIVDWTVPTRSELEQDDGWEHEVRVQTNWGLRIIHCRGWRRPCNRKLAGEDEPNRDVVETWILGWGWNAVPLLAWDDSEHKGGTPEFSRIIEFKKKMLG